MLYFLSYPRPPRSLKKLRSDIRRCKPANVVFRRRMPDIRRNPVFRRNIYGFLRFWPKNEIAPKCVENLGEGLGNRYPLPKPIYRFLFGVKPFFSKGCARLVNFWVHDKLPTSQALFQNDYFRPKDLINGQKDLRICLGVLQ